MPNKQAAIKDLRKNKRHAAINHRIKTNVKALFKKGIAIVKDGKKAEAIEAARLFQQAVDKAAKHHVISKNASRHKKAALMKSVNAKV